jgi:hypothetical protein
MRGRGRRVDSALGLVRLMGIGKGIGEFEAGVG